MHMLKTIMLSLAIAAAAIFAKAEQIIPREYGEERFSYLIDRFNSEDDEIYVNTIPNSEAKKFLASNIPLFDCPDDTIAEVYYFRWWTFRKHILKTPNGYVITEFSPKVFWSGQYNTISCAAPHHIREGRWLRDEKIISDYIRFWSTAKHIRNFSFWYADSALQFHLVKPDLKLLKDMYPSFKSNYGAWEKSNRDPENNLFWIRDQADGMELSISGSLNARWEGYRPTINSYMFAECRAISKIAALLGEDADVKPYADKAAELKNLINEKLWDPEDKFFKVMPKNGYCGKLSDVREQLGYTPWYFNIPPEEYAEAWKQILDERGFKSKYGLTTAERRDGRFSINYIGHECQWNGPVWPYSTSVTLTALANLLNSYSNKPVSKNDYFEALKTYASSHFLVNENGKKVFWIDECQNPDNGDWITRAILIREGKKFRAYYKERGKDYNHSTFNDLVITGLVGLRPNAGNSLTVNPLVPDDWKFFCLENVRCKGSDISIFWDADGSRYKKGAGLFVFINGKCAAHSKKLEKLDINL